MRVARQREEIENRVGSGDTTQPQHATVERQNVYEIVSCGHEWRRRARGAGRVHDVPDDGFRIVRRARSAKTKRFGVRDIVRLGRDWKPREIGQTAHVAANEAGICEYSPVIRMCGEDPIERGGEPLFAQRGKLRGIGCKQRIHHRGHSLRTKGRAGTTPQ